MNNCGTCKHWGSVRTWRFREDPNSEIVWRRCGRIVDATDASESELADELAYTEDGEEFYSALMTKADFGCVSWEPKQ